MERAFHQRGDDSRETNFDRTAGDDDAAAARGMLASGLLIHIARRDTPAGHVVRIYRMAGRRSSVVSEAAARALGR